MTAVHAKLESGSLINEMRVQWPGIYKAIEDIIGDTGTIFPLLDPDHIVTATTSLSREHHASGIAATLTYSEAPTAFDTPADLSDPDKFQGIIPLLSTNGSDEHVTTPDAAYYSRDDAGGANGFSLGMWVNLSSLDACLGMDKGNGSDDEWEWHISTSTGKQKFRLIDVSVAKKPHRETSTAMVINRWYFVSATYDGAGGANAADSLHCYTDGVLNDAAASNEALYVGMEADIGGLSLFVNEALSSGWLPGKVAGGPLSPFFTQIELTAAQNLHLYRIGRQALGL
jgi:hypothetical protein